MIKLKDLLMKESPDNTISPRTGKEILWDNTLAITFLMNEKMLVCNNPTEEGLTHWQLFNDIKHIYSKIPHPLSEIKNFDELVFFPNADVAYGQLKPYGSYWAEENDFVNGRIFPDDNFLGFWKSDVEVKRCKSMVIQLMDYWKLDINDFIIETYDRDNSIYPRTTWDKLK